MSHTTKPVEAPHFRVSSSKAEPPTEQQDAENLRRIRACVNACETISTEDLERGVVQDMQRVLQQVAPIVEEWCREKSRAVAQSN